MISAHGSAGDGSPAAALVVLVIIAFFLWVHLAVHARTPGTAPVAVAAAGGGVAALLHWAVVPEHLSVWWPSALFFLLCGLAQVVWAQRLLRAPSRAIVLAGLVGNSAIVALWWWSRTLGVPLGPDPVPVAPGVLDTVCVAAELVSVVLCAYLLGRPVSTGVPADEAHLYSEPGPGVVSAPAPSRSR
ncbi:MAG: hypothetical protein ACT4P1_06660 [Sporichthyaceae bacterium]